MENRVHLVQLVNVPKGKEGCQGEEKVQLESVAKKGCQGEKDAMEMMAVPVNDPKEKKSDKGDNMTKGALGNADSRRKGR
jgi:hypothetical protein